MGQICIRPFNRVCEPGNLERTVDELTGEVNTFLATLAPSDVLKVDQSIRQVRNKVVVSYLIVFLEV